MDDTQLFALHYVYQPRINLALREFRLQYNHHPLRTVQNQSPFQIFHEGVLQFSSHSGSRGIIEGRVSDAMYGVDEYQLHNQVMMMTLLKLSALGILYSKMTMSNCLWRWTPLKMMENMKYLYMFKY